MANTYEIAFDVSVDWHEWIEAEESWEAEELACQLLDKGSDFYSYIIARLQDELCKTPYIEPTCVGENNHTATLTKEQIDECLKED